jgi:hypothetical protein
MRAATEVPSFTVRGCPLITTSIVTDIAANLPPPARGGSPQARTPPYAVTHPARCKDHDISAVVSTMGVK